MEKQKLPNATVVLVLGILSLPLCCCWGGGAILGIIALVLANKDMALYRANPELYSNYSILNTGRIVAIVGIVLGAIGVMLTIFGTAITPEQIQAWGEEFQAKQNQ